MSSLAAGLLTPVCVQIFSFPNSCSRQITSVSSAFTNLPTSDHNSGFPDNTVQFLDHIDALTFGSKMDSALQGTPHYCVTDVTLPQLLCTDILPLPDCCCQPVPQHLEAIIRAVISLSINRNINGFPAYHKKLPWYLRSCSSPSLAAFSRNFQHISIVIIRCGILSLSFLHAFHPFISKVTSCCCSNSFKQRPSPRSITIPHQHSRITACIIGANSFLPGR